MSSPPHIIRRQVVEVRLPPGADSRAVQARLSHLCREVVARLLDEHLSQYAGPAPVRLARVELDLGTIALPDLEHLLPQRLADELRRVLPPAVLAPGPAVPQTQPGSSSPAPAPAPAAPASGPDLDLIAHFLRSGLLPWWATPVTYQRLSEAFTHAQTQAGAALRRLLAGLLDEPFAVERLVNTCPDALLEQLLSLWLPAASARRRPLSQLRAALLGPLNGSAQDSAAARVAWWYGLYKTAASSVASGQHEAPAIYRMLTRFIGVKGGGLMVAPLAEQGVSDLLSEVFQGEDATHTPASAGRAATSGLGASPAAAASRAAVRPLGAAAAPPRLTAEPPPAANNSSTHPDATRPPSRPPASPLEPEGANIRPTAKTGPATTPGAFNDSDKISIYNTGLVLLSPFLPRFFATLGLTSEGRFATEAAATRACLLLQYLVDGTSEDCFEALLPLNKLLCGIELAQPLPTAWVISPEEAEAATNLLEAVIQNGPLWRTLSVDAFRQAFLRREGLLSTRDGHWLLQAARETHDVIIDRLPWAVRHIRLPWMKHLLFTEWQQV